MTCLSCSQTPKQAPDLLNSNDLLVIDHHEIRQLQEHDWPADKHKLLIFFPEIFTPVCQSELGSINQWLPAFSELNCQIVAACTDQALAIKDWYEQESLLHDLNCLTFSSYLLPVRLGLVENGRAKRSSVFVMADGTIVKQEHFHTVGRSFAELHRMLYGYSTGSYCAEGWTKLDDGFLVS